jgi:hypothetical protein
MLDPFTRTRFRSEYDLETWYPEGDLDGATARSMVKFIGFQESISDHPFDRFSDLSGLTGIHLDFIEIMDLAATRRATYDGGPPVKSAIFAPSRPAYAVGRMFAAMMDPSPIEVQVFLVIEDAAEWLGVPVEALNAEP